MTRAWLSLGSNLHPETHIRGAVAALRQVFGELRLSRVYESQAVGFDGDPFLNLVVGLDMDSPVAELDRRLRAIEAAHGRERGGERFGPRTLDIDLLTYGDLVLRDGALRLPREDITRYAFVLRPLAEVAGDERHPLLGASYRELWASFEQRDQPLRPVPFEFPAGDSLSAAASAPHPPR